MRKIAIIFIMTFIFFIGSSYAIELQSNYFLIDLVTILNGGGPASSTNNVMDFSAVGESTGSTEEFSSAKFTLKAGNLFMFLPLPHWEELRWLISDLRAKTDILGPTIPEATWQKDNDPYFYWNILIVPPTLIEGFSVSLDTTPDLIIDTDATSYQFVEDAILSGIHTFYVLPFLSEAIAEEESLLQFEIWVDVDLPMINQPSPSAGAVISEKDILISASLVDNHSGLDLDLLTFTLNGEGVSFDYDAEKETLSSKEKVSLREGKNTVLIKAYDNVGNYTVKGWDFVVDTEPPSGKILLNAGESVTHSAYVAINIEASDTVSGIKNIYLSNDGVFDTELNHPYPYSPVIYDWLVAQPDIDGVKTVFAKIQDSAGNLSEAYKDDIYLKRLTPDTRIISGPVSITPDTSADFKFEATKPGCLFIFKLDNQDWSQWSSSSEAHFSGLSQGNHYFYVKSGFDLNGDGKITIDEEDPSPSQWVWTIRTEGYFEKLRERILFWRR